jgi:flagellin
MSLRINTNVAALNAHRNLVKNDNSLTSSLERLSSGLRINKAADDASGMAIADALKSQALGLGQAIKNANDAISMVQTADGALQESINIVNTIKTKAIQAAQDGQTTDTRKAIQSDINKLMEELDLIARTTSFNGQKLLSGNFTNKRFQIGAFSGETVKVSIGSTESTKVGHVSASNLTFAGEGVSELDLYSNLQNTTYSLNSIEIRYDNSRDHSLAAVADAINKLSDLLGISARAEVSSTTDSNVQAGTTDSSFAINGVDIGAVTVAVNDADGKLVAAINNKTDQTGVVASVDQAGKLTLTSTDGRAIKVTQGTNTTAVLGGTADMSTLGYVKVNQAGAGEIMISDRNAQAGIAVSTVDGSIKASNVSGATTQISVLTAGSQLASGSVLGSGSVLMGTFKLENGAGASLEVSSGGSIAGKGSILLSGSVIGSGITLTGAAEIEENAGTNGNSTITVGTFLEGGGANYLESGTIFQGDVTAYLSGLTDGSVVLSGGNTYVTSGASVKVGGFTLTAGATIGSGSILESGTILAVGSKVYDDLTLQADMTVGSNMDLGKTSYVVSGSTMSSGTVFVNVLASGSGNITGTTTLKVNSIVEDASYLANGSSIGAAIALQEDETVAANKDMLVAEGSVISSGSIITAGTVLTNDILADDGTWYAAGTTLVVDITTGSGVALEKDMILNGGSILTSGTVLAANSVRIADTVESSTSAAEAYRLADVDVTSQEGAQIAIAIADSALKSLDKIRSDLGSVQNQLTSTVSNISVTQVNIYAAESSIRDVDFAEESANFTKMQILMQAGTFAMAQSNASAQNVLQLLQ